MQVNNIPIDELKPFVKNPKKHPEKQIKFLQKSFKEFGWTNPILIAEDNMIVAGHGRWEAAKQAGFTEVPVIKLDMPYEKAVAYVIADNHLAELAETDTEQLAELLQEISQIEDFDIEAIGYSDEDIDTLLHEIEAHDSRYLPGVGGIAGNVEFIENETDALAAESDAIDIFHGRNVILVTFSGGKDSTFALLWAKHNFPEKRIVAVFSETGMEFPGMTAHIRDVCIHMGVEYKIVKPEKDVWEYWAEHDRFFNIIFPECQNAFIFKPINDYMKTFDKDTCVIIDGSRADQARRLSRKTKTSGNDSMPGYVYYHPVFNIDEGIEKEIIRKSGVPVWEGYAMGFRRSACWCCPAQSSEQAYALSINYPGLVDVIRRWEKRLGSPLQFSNNRGIDTLIDIGKRKHQKRLDGGNVEDDWITSPTHEDETVI